MLKSPAVFILTLLCVFISACATTLDYQSPNTVDLSGDWILNKELSQEIILASKRSAKGSKPGGRDGSGRAGGRKGGRSGEGSPNRGEKNNKKKHNGSRANKPDAMISAAMTIEQSSDSMGIRYQNQNYREVDWGKNEHRGVTTTAGWNEEILIIETNGKRLSFSESYHLDRTGKVLIVTFELAGEEFYRVYDKTPSNSQ